MRLRTILALFLACATPTLDLCADVEARHDEGLPFFTVFTLDHLGMGAVSLELTQDESGRLLAFDEGVILVFDGSAWTSRLSAASSNSDSVTIARTDARGIMHAGSVGTWGTITVNGEGDYVFRSTNAERPAWTSAAHFDNVLPSRYGVFFTSALGVALEGIDGKCHFWTDRIPARFTFEYRGEVFLSTGSSGLYRFDGNGWIPIRGTDNFSNSEAISCMTVRTDGQAILSSLSGKLYYFDGRALTRWHSEADALLESGVADIAALPNNEIAVAVRGYGIVVLDAEGNIQMRLGADHDDSFAGISDIFQTENGIIWASLPGAVAKIYYPSQVTFYDYRFDLPIQWPEVYHFQNRIVIYSSYNIFLGVYDEGGRVQKFERLDFPGIGLVESCLGIGDELIFGSGGNMFAYDGKELTQIASGISSARLFRAKGRDDCVVVLGRDKHALLVRKHGRWTVEQVMPSTGFPAVAIQTSDGEYWIEQGVGSACRLWVGEDGRMAYKHFSGIEGLENIWLNVWNFGGEVFLSSGQVTRRYDRETGALVQDSQIDELLRSIGGHISRIFESPGGDIFASAREGVFLVRREDGNDITVDREALRPVSEPHTLVRFEGDSIAWLLSRNRVIRYDAGRQPPDYRPLKPMISQATATDMHSGETTQLALRDGGEAVHLPYRQNSLTLRFFPNTYSLPSPPQYRYRIAGITESWTPTIDDTVISLTNIREGSYLIEVEVLDQGISVGAISSFRVEIEPPWIRTPWAYFSYACLLLAAILSIVRISQRHSERERRRLEKLVQERTGELNDTNQRLHESIKSAVAAAEAKSRFLANMSHEIRTPMNGVVGTSELLARTSLSSEQRELVDIINKSGSLLLNIVNDVLDYSKIEADQIVFEMIPLRPQTILDDVLEILSEKSNEKHIEFFGGLTSGTPHELIGDTTRVQQILVNLSSNALKFTDKGEVEIKGWAAPRPDGRWDLHFSVRDTGIGMDAQGIGRLFKAFSQLDASNTRVYGGTGLGLAISKRLVEHMGGQMDVTSEPGKGSRFHFFIPMPPSERAATEALPSASQKCSVLLVDDCGARRELTKTFLENHGCEVSHMECAQAPRHLAAGHRHDVVVADCTFGSNAWREVADAVARLRNTPLIVYRLPLQPVEHPAIVRRLSKPWRCNRLLAEIRACMDIRPTIPETGLPTQGTGDQSLPAESLRVLLAEDNPVNQRVAVLLLGRLGIRPDLAANGREAVELVHLHDYDIILMDVQMPVMDGIQATLRVRSELAREEQPIVVALTAGAMSSDREAAFNAGVDAYLTKPLRLETLREQLGDLMEKVRMRRAANESR
jgi:signal transduction histidine kinase/ActR/RegA family two-component response regulator